MSRDILDGIPIAGVTGINGAGKTLLAVSSAIHRMKQGEPVYSTVKIESEFGNSRPIRSLRELTTLRNCTILLDEVSVVFSSRSSQTLPPDVVILIQTLRHSGVGVIWTAPEWMRCDNLLRGVTQGLVNVVPLLKKSDGTPWPRPRVMLAGLLDTSQGKVDATPTKVLRRRMYLPTKLDGWGAYDSLADTPMLGNNLRTGRCIDCGGSMDVPKHSEARHEMLGIPWYPGEAHRHVPEFEETSV
jgi:hypothetical protein